MNRAFDPYTVRRLLHDGIAKGHWTVAHLDQPSEGWLINEQQSQRIYGFTHPPHRNIARDPDPGERVQPVSPRDFDVAATTSPNSQSSNLDLLPTKWPPIPGQRDGGDFGNDQDPHRPRADQPVPPRLGASRFGVPFSPGEFLEDPENPDLDW